MKKPEPDARTGVGRTGVCGNTNRNPESFARVMRSVDGLFAFGDDVVVSPGHGLDTTLGRERPYVEVWRRRGW